MARMALYRTWRSQTFEDVVGQQHITQTLQNSIREGRLSHAYLFTGPRGTGKTSTAKILAKAVNCEKGPAAEPCNECEACRRITSGACIDVSEFDAASNRGVDEIRDIRDKVKYAPTEVRYKVYIIDEVHMLTTEAFNALLKTLEEPPEHVLFILATTEPHKVPATIHSRCQRFDFRRISPVEQAARMKVICEAEGIEAEEEALALIARLSEGGMRDALSLLDQATSFAGGRVTAEQVLSMTGGVARERLAELAGAIAKGDVAFVLDFVEGLMREGRSADKVLEGFLAFLRDLLLVKLVSGSSAVKERFSPQEIEKLSAAAEQFPNDRLFQMIDTVNGYLGEMKYAAQPQTMLEVALLKLCVPAPALGAGNADLAAGATAGELNRLAEQLKQLISRVERLEQREARGFGGAADAGRASAPAEQAAFGPRTRDRKASPSPGISSIKSPGALEPFLASRDSEPFHRVAQEWPTLLQQVKERKITVHAWLVDGQPVSATEDAVLVAFKNSIHRETTEKPANKQLIEGVMAELFGKPMRLVTMLMKEWEAANEAGAASQPAEELVLTPESDEPGDSGGKRYKEEWINEAISVFGEDLVVVKD